MRECVAGRPNSRWSVPPFRMLFADEGDGLVRAVDATGNGHVLRVCQRRLSVQEAAPGPIHQPGPHFADQNQWSILNVLYLQELPDQHEFEHCADASRRDYEGIRGQHKVMQPREKRLMLKGLPVDEGRD